MAQSVKSLLGSLETYVLLCNPVAMEERAQQISKAGQPSLVFKHQDQGKTPSQEVKVESK